MFRFLNPQMFYWLWLLPIAIGLWWWLNKHQQYRLHKFVEQRLIKKITVLNSKQKIFISKVMLILVYIGLVVAMTGPQISLTRSELASQGLDIFFIVDTSRSMAVKDVEPSRLTRARRALFSLVEKLSKNRMGIIPFAGEAFVQCPLTTDTSTLNLIIDNLNINTLPKPGTDLGKAVQLAITSFKRTGAKHKVIIILSDGENFGQAPTEFIKKAAKEGIKTYCLAVGTEEGGEIPGMSKKDNKKTPISKAKHKELRKIAFVGQGAYIQLMSGGEEELEIVKELNRLEKIELLSEHYQVWSDYYFWPVMISLLLLVIDFLLSKRKGFTWFGKKGKQVSNKIIFLIIILLASTKMGEAASKQKLINQGIAAFKEQRLPEAEKFLNKARQEHAGEALAEYNLGCILLAQSKYLEAYQAFTRGYKSAEKQLLQDCWYNLGYTAFYLGLQQGESDRWVEAVEAFKQVLILNPEDYDARYNLELILREIKRRTKQSARQEKQDQGGKKGKQEGGGGGADKPGKNREKQQGKKSDQAPPREEQEESNKRKDQGERSKTSEQRKGNRQSGMSQEEALRTLRSLENQEKTLKNKWSQDSGEEDSYKGPAW